MAKVQLRGRLRSRGGLGKRGHRGARSAVLGGDSPFWRHAVWTAESRALVGDLGAGHALSDEQYTLLAPLIPPAKPGGRPRSADMRRLLDGLFYLVRTGCRWRHLPPPPAFPPWRTVYGYMRAFADAGVWETIRHPLVTMLREQEPHRRDRRHPEREDERKRSHAGGWRLGLVGRGRHRTAWRRPMPTDHPATTPQATGRADDAKLFASLELSKSRWLVTVSAPGSEKLSKHAVSGGDGGALLDLPARLRAMAERRAGVAVQVVVIQEAGLDGFWVHRLLEANGIESHVVDPASIAVDRRHRRAKTDAIDGEKLVRTLMAWARGERRVCSMVRPPSPEEEDRRRLTRERGTPLKERTRHTNRIKGLLAGQGVTDYDPLRKDRLTRLDALRTGDGRPLPERLEAEIERVELVASQMALVERERDALVGTTSGDEPATAAAALARLKGIGTELGSLLRLEALFRHFDNRPPLAPYARLAPSPGQRGGAQAGPG